MKHCDNLKTEKIDAWIACFKLNALAPLVRPWVPRIINDAHDTTIRTLRKARRNNPTPELDDEILNSIKLRRRRSRSGLTPLDIVIAAEIVRVLEFSKGDRVLIDRIYNFLMVDYMTDWDTENKTTFGGKEFNFKSLLPTRGFDPKDSSSITQWANYMKKDLLINICKQLNVATSLPNRKKVLEIIVALQWPDNKYFFNKTESALKGIDFK